MPEPKPAAHTPGTLALPLSYSNGGQGALDTILDADGRTIAREVVSARAEFRALFGRLSDLDALAAALERAVTWADAQPVDAPAEWQEWAFDARAALARVRPEGGAK